MAIMLEITFFVQLDLEIKRQCCPEIVSHNVSICYLFPSCPLSCTMLMCIQHFHDLHAPNGAIL